jgi:hypothetical protein
MNKEQLELFPLVEDNRLKQLENHIRFQLTLYPLWVPSVKQLKELSDQHRVSMRKPLEVWEKLWEERSWPIKDIKERNESQV